MNTYIVEIDGNANLQSINNAIVREEAVGAEFLRSSLSSHEGRITNLATFNDLPAGTRPSKDIELHVQTDPAPSGKATVWSGVMLVSGANMAVVAYR
jgi:hypothetical protein